ncbi:uncharacterized protein LOC100177787 [Ciona intestinalis]
MTSSSRHYYVIMKVLYVISSFLFATCVAETWYELNDLEYFIYRGQKQNFSSAESFCEERNASLVLIKSKQVQDFLVEKIGISTGRPHSFYIGLLRIINGTKHGFQWMDGTPLTFTQWRNREPNNKLQMEGCVQMGRRGRLEVTYSWNDMPCHSNTKIICQRPVKEKVTTSNAIVTTSVKIATTQVSLNETLIKSSTVKDSTVLPITLDTETLTNVPTTRNPTTLYGALVTISTAANTSPQTDHTSSFYTIEFNPTSSEPLPISTMTNNIITTTSEDQTVKLTTQEMLRSSAETQMFQESTTVGTTRKPTENQYTDETKDPSTQTNPATTPYLSSQYEKHTTTPQQSKSTTTEALAHITEPTTTASMSLDETTHTQAESPAPLRTTIPTSTIVVPDTKQVTTSLYTLLVRTTESYTKQTVAIDTQDDTTLSPTTTTTQTTTTTPHTTSSMVGHDISRQTQEEKTTNENIVTTHAATTKQTIVPRPTDIISTSRKVTRINQEPSTIKSVLKTTEAIQHTAQTDETQATTNINADLPDAGARVMVTEPEGNNLNVAGAGGSSEQCDCPPYYIIGIVIAILAIIAALVILGIWKRKERKRMQRIDEEREGNPRHLNNDQY